MLVVILGGKGMRRVGFQSRFATACWAMKYAVPGTSAVLRERLKHRGLDGVRLKAIIGALRDPATTEFGLQMESDTGRSAVCN